MIIIFTISLNAQVGCDYSLSGYVLDAATKKPLETALIFNEDTGQSTLSNEQGYFELQNLCTGELHLSITHLNCAAVREFIVVKGDSTITFYLEHHSELLDEIVIHGHHDNSATAFSTTISEQELEDKSFKSLGDLASSIAGVSTLKNGNTSSKPIVHGLYGNRLTILNNGISQSGQQWGNDHAPEIDAGSAHHISVVKGASTLEYIGSNLGSVLLVDTDNVGNDPHLRGRFNYIYNTNGRAHSFNAGIEKKSRLFDWRVNGTVKHSGDQKTPDYFLRNTGRREADFSIQLDRNQSEKWQSQIYISSFNAELGILRGSHVSNLTDLEAAINRDVPFFTEENFSDSIVAPRQQVNHHLVKLESKHFLNSVTVLKFKYGGQMNQRKEYDVRRSGRSVKPTLSLRQFTHFGEAKLITELGHNMDIKTGLQLQMIDNANIAGTGVLPLIPDFVSYNPAFYTVLQKNLGAHQFEVGGRYDYIHYDVNRITRTIPAEVINEKHSFHNLAFSSGTQLDLKSGFNLGFNLGLMMRAPQVNELYADGLHQGISGIEQGSPNLKQEASVKFLSQLDWTLNNKLFLQTLFYIQRVNNYIYLQAQQEFILTIRGAFPLYLYEQTNARLYGLDFLASYQISDQLKGISKFSLIRGDDLTNKLSIVNLPADNIKLEIEYALHPGQKVQNTVISIEGQYVFRQNRINSEQDFLETPNAYFLLQAALDTEIRIKDNRMRLGLFAENLLNTRYRDYLNRLRYFADEPGINIGVRMNYKWGN